MCLAEFTVHYEFTVHSAEFLAESANNSADFCVFKKFLVLSLIKHISVKFS
jgi:hypothetical protein